MFVYKFSTRFDVAAALWETVYFCAEVGGGMADWQRDLSSRNGCFNTGVWQYEPSWRGSFRRLVRDQPALPLPSPALWQSLGRSRGVTLHLTTIYCISALYCTILHCTALHFTVLHYIALNWTVTVLYCTPLDCPPMHSTALHCTALYYFELQCTARIYVVQCSLVKKSVVYYSAVKWSTV